jgi:hypothetical protein
MSASDKLKQFIREEVKRAIKEELSKSLKEHDHRDYRSSIEAKVNSKPPVKPSNKSSNMRQFDNSNPLAQLLQETALSFTSDDARAFGGGGGSPVSFSEPMKTQVGTVNDMLSTARKSSNLDMVSIDTVPDFSEFMKKMKKNGEI